MTTLERTAAIAFRDELLKIAADGAANDNDLDKTAAIELFNNMSIEHVEQFLKEAGFFEGLKGMVGGAAKGLGSMGMGALRGGGNVIKGVAGGMKDMAMNAGRAIKAAPGNIGQSMANLGQRMQQGGARIGQGWADSGRSTGMAARARMAGGVQPGLPGMQGWSGRGAPAAGGITNSPLQVASGPSVPQGAGQQGNMFGEGASGGIGNKPIQVHSQVVPPQQAQGDLFGNTQGPPASGVQRTARPATASYGGGMAPAA